METSDLIEALGKDAKAKAASLAAVLTGAGLAAIIVAFVLFAVLIGPRPDLAAAAGTPRFLFKFVVTLALVLAAAALLAALARPGASRRTRAQMLLVAPLLLGVAVAVEFLAVPREAWAARWIGTNIAVCLTYIPLIGIGPLSLFLVALRHGAPTQPALAGAVAGLLAGGIAATLYAAHCTDDSPFFVATWYSIAIAGLAIFGALAGRAVLRW
jgi:hypothetical protein